MQVNFCLQSAAGDQTKVITMYFVRGLDHVVPVSFCSFLSHFVVLRTYFVVFRNHFVQQRGNGPPKHLKTSYHVGFEGTLFVEHQKEQYPKLRGTYPYQSIPRRIHHYYLLGPPKKTSETTAVFLPGGSDFSLTMLDSGISE